MWHHPLFSSSAHGNDPRSTEFWQALTAARVDVVLNGHDHGYERFDPQDATGAPSPKGMRSFIVGTGGKSLYDFAEPEPNSAARIHGFGFLRMELKALSYQWQFIREPEEAAPSPSQPTDGGAATCTPKPRKRQ